MNMLGTLTVSGSSSNMFSGKPSIHALLDTKPRVAMDRMTTKRPNSSLYEVLRVDKNATPIEIKTAYRSLAKIYHPDASSRNHGDHHDFIDIHNAYATLSDPEARAMYDQTTGFRRKYTAGYNTRRRWETDQCW
uniref:chaperone protein dnaJ 11, chloroplastic-like n=1 Tax=Erigeron canadensis TaxID=72917 RepID=UPI001CB9668B|nr:chaperone protein dnaJ 11, chloroplastic-like [Erigeron canadensis]